MGGCGLIQNLTIQYKIKIPMCGQSLRFTQCFRNDYRYMYIDDVSQTTDKTWHRNWTDFWPSSYSSTTLLLRDTMYCSANDQCLTFQAGGCHLHRTVHDFVHFGVTARGGGLAFDGVWQKLLTMSSYVWCHFFSYCNCGLAQLCH